MYNMYTTINLHKLYDKLHQLGICANLEKYCEIYNGDNKFMRNGDTVPIKPRQKKRTVAGKFSWVLYDGNVRETLYETDWYTRTNLYTYTTRDNINYKRKHIIISEVLICK